MSTAPITPFPVTRVAHIQGTHRTPPWLVDSLWGDQAVGFIGGTPKTGKTWLALELAVAVASGKPCLGRFQVNRPGHAIIYAAEDAAHAVKHRVASIARTRRIDLQRLPVGLITAPALHLDAPQHQQRLMATVAKIKPRLLVLDPLVRLHRGDENSAADVSALLSFLRTLQREHQLAIALVHHVRKTSASQPGQALRGSGDLHAWSDSNLYLLRRKDRVELHAEHRSHPCPRPALIELSDTPALHLDLLGPVDEDDAQPPSPLEERVIDALTASPMNRTALRDQLRVRNETLGHTLTDLEAQGRLIRHQGLLTVPRSRA